MLCIIIRKSETIIKGNIVMTSRSLFSLERLRIGNEKVIETLISNAFPKSNKHSWSRALGIESNLSNYLEEYLRGIEINIGNSIGMKNIETNSFVGTIILETHTFSSLKDELKKDDNEEYSSYGAIEGIMNSCKDIFLILLGVANFIICYFVILNKTTLLNYKLQF